MNNTCLGKRVRDDSHVWCVTLRNYRNFIGSNYISLEQHEQSQNRDDYDTLLNDNRIVNRAYLLQSSRLGLFHNSETLIIYGGYT